MPEKPKPRAGARTAVPAPRAAAPRAAVPRAAVPRSAVSAPPDPPAAPPPPRWPAKPGPRASVTVNAAQAETLAAYFRRRLAGKSIELEDAAILARIEFELAGKGAATRTLSGAVAGACLLEAVRWLPSRTARSLEQEFEDRFNAALRGSEAIAPILETYDIIAPQVPALVDLVWANADKDALDVFRIAADAATRKSVEAAVAAAQG